MPKLFTKIVYSTRPLNLFIVFFTYFLLYIVGIKLSSSDGELNLSFIPDSNYLFYTLSMILIYYCGYLINDLFDVKADKINKPDRVIFTSNNSIWLGILIYVVLSLISLILTIGSSLLLTEINFIIITLLFLYSLYFKKVVLWGNIIVGLICAYVPFSVLILHEPQSWSEWNNFTYLIFFYSAFTLVTTLMREIIKDAEDIEGDKHAGIKTLPMLIGYTRTNTLVIFLNVVLLTILGYFLSKLSDYNLSPVAEIILYLILSIPNLFLIKNSASAKQKNDYTKLSKQLKFYMLIGLLSLSLFIL